MPRLSAIGVLVAFLLFAGCSRAPDGPKDDPEELKKIAEAKFQAGRDALAAKHFDEAVTLFEEALRITPLHKEGGELLSHAREQAKEAKRIDLVATGRKALAANDDEAAIAAFSESLQIALDDNVRTLRAMAVKNLWKKAGAEFGWMRVKSEGLTFFIDYRPGVFAPPGNVTKDYIPSFKFREWKAGLLEKVPVPNEVFGLDLSFTAFGDENIEELARFKSIEILDVNFSKLTLEGKQALIRSVFARWMSR